MQNVLIMDDQAHGQTLRSFEEMDFGPVSVRLYYHKKRCKAKLVS